MMRNVTSAPRRNRRSHRALGAGLLAASAALLLSAAAWAESDSLTAAETKELRSVGRTVLRDRAAARMAEAAKLEDERRYLDEMVETLADLEGVLRAEQLPRRFETRADSDVVVRGALQAPSGPPLAAHYDAGTPGPRGDRGQSQSEVRPSRGAPSPEIARAPAPTDFAERRNRVRHAVDRALSRIVVQRALLEERVGGREVPSQRAAAPARGPKALSALVRRDRVADKLDAVEATLLSIEDSDAWSVERVRSLRESLVLGHRARRTATVPEPTLHTRTKHFRPAAEGGEQ